MKKTLEEWERHIYMKWLESVGVFKPENYSVLKPDITMSFYKAVSSYQRAIETDGSRKKSSLISSAAKEAAEYVKISITNGNLDNIRNLFNALNKIKNGEHLKLTHNAINRVGLALLGFLFENDRLPKSREDFLQHTTSIKYRICDLSPSRLSEMLDYYGVNAAMRIKRGPKPRK